MHKSLVLVTQKAISLFITMRLNNICNVFVALMLFDLAKTITASRDFLLEDSSGDGDPGCQFQCKSNLQCIPYDYLCDGTIDCKDLSDEDNCEGRGIKTITYAPHRNKIQNISEILGAPEARKRLTEWILKHRNSGYDTDKWSLQVPRIAIALFFESENFFQVGNKTGEELRYEITIQALKKLSKLDKISALELSLYINAMLVICMNPRDFHGFNLVAELRRRVDANIYANPMEILVLCNAGDTMTSGDVDRVNRVNVTKKHPSWRETQAIAVLAMSCIHHNSRIAKNMAKSVMLSNLLKGQARNGSIGNVKTTALVLQALIASQKLEVKDFDLESAIRFVLRSQKDDGSFGSLINSYCVLPVLNHKSFANSNTQHCRPSYRTDKQRIYDSWTTKDRKLKVQLSVVDGKEADVKKAWTLNVPKSSSFYEIMEVVSLMDPKLKIIYSIFDGKPFVSAVFGIENDPELGLYWFTYSKNSSSGAESTKWNQSPVDFVVHSSQELILWYKEGTL